MEQMCGMKGLHAQCLSMLHQLLIYERVKESHRPSVLGRMSSGKSKGVPKRVKESPGENFLGRVKKCV